MLKQLADKLKESNYDIDIDEDGIYVNDTDIDIIIEDEAFLLSLDSFSERHYKDTIDEVIDVNNCVKMMNDMKTELYKNNLTFKDVDSHMIYVKEFSIFYENSKLHLEGIDGSVSASSNPSGIISDLEDYQVI